MKSKLPYITALFFLLISSVFAQTSDLSINVLVDNDVPYVRSTVKFTITITNIGPDEATGVSIYNEFGSGFGQISSISDNGIVAGNTLNWYDLVVPKDTNISLHFSARVLTKGKYFNKAEIVASDSYDPTSDPNTSFYENDLDDRYADDDEFVLSIVALPSNFDDDRQFDKDDIDDDNDGIPDIYESYGINPDADFDDDGTPVYLDDNDDNFDIGDNDSYAESFFDFDRDSIPNHLDYDADGDGILDIYETGFKDLEISSKGKLVSDFRGFGVNGLLDKLETSPDSGELINGLLNTDSDDNWNFLDIDDDNDGILTSRENADPNGDGNPEDALDSDNDGIPDYLDYDDHLTKNQLDGSVVIDSIQPEIKTATIVARRSVVEVKLFTEKGNEITPSIQRVGNLVQLDISNLESGVYFLQFITGNKIDIKRMVID